MPSAGMFLSNVGGRSDDNKDSPATENGWSFLIRRNRVYSIICALAQLVFRTQLSWILLLGSGKHFVVSSNLLSLHTLPTAHLINYWVMPFLIHSAPFITCFPRNARRWQVNYVIRQWSERLAWKSSKAISNSVGRPAADISTGSLAKIGYNSTTRWFIELQQVIYQHNILSRGNLLTQLSR